MEKKEGTEFKEEIIEDKPVFLKRGPHKLKSKLLGKKTVLGKINPKSKPKPKPKESNAKYLVESILKTYWTSKWKEQLIIKKYSRTGFNKKRANFRNFCTKLNHAMKYHQYLYLIKLFDNMEQLPEKEGVKHENNYGKLKIVCNNENKNIIQNNNNNNENTNFIFDNNGLIEIKVDAPGLIEVEFVPAQEEQKPDNKSPPSQLNELNDKEKEKEKIKDNNNNDKNNDIIIKNDNINIINNNDNKINITHDIDRKDKNTNDNDKNDINKNDEKNITTTNDNNNKDKEIDNSNNITDNNINKIKDNIMVNDINSNNNNTINNDINKNTIDNNNNKENIISNNTENNNEKNILTIDNNKDDNNKEKEIPIEQKSIEEKDKNINSNDIIIEKNSIYNDSNFWQTNPESLLNEKEMQDLLDDLLLE